MKYLLLTGIDMLKNIVKLTILILGGHIRCAECGHRVNLRTIYSHVSTRHPEMMESDNP